MSEQEQGPATSRSGAARPFIFVLLDVFDAMPVHAMPRAERAVLIAIAAHAHPDGTGAFPSLARMSRRIGYGTSAIVEAIQELSRRRWLLVAERRDPETGAATSNGYTVLLDGERWGEDEAAKRKRRPPLRRAEPASDPFRRAEAPFPPGGSPLHHTAEGASPHGGSPLSAGRQLTANEHPMIPQSEQPRNTGDPVGSLMVEAQVRETPRTEHRQEGGATIGGAGAVLADLCVPPAVETVVGKQAAGTTPALPGLEAVVDPDPAPPKPKPEDLVWAAYLEGRTLARVKGGAPVLDAKRKAVIAARLKDGFTVEDLCCAARGIWRSDWHLENGHTSLDLALRNAAQIERFREDGKPPKPVDPEWERRRRGPPAFVPPPLSAEEQQAILDQYFPGVYTKKAAANG